MADILDSAIIRRMIGREFAALRQKAGLTLEQVAQKVEKGRGTIARIEEGAEAVRFKTLEVKGLLDLYEAEDEVRERILQLTAETRNNRREFYYHDYTETVLPEWMKLFYTLENTAEVIRRYESELVPGLLQTRRYAQQMMTTPRGFATEEQAELRVQLRLDRQSVLTKKSQPPKYEVVLNEAVLSRKIGGDEVMVEQINHLLQMSKKSNISLRVLPFSAGLHAGAVASAFSLMDFPEEVGEPPLAFVDIFTGAIYLYGAEQLSAYRLLWENLTEKTLTEEETRDFLQETLKGLLN